MEDINPISEVKTKAPKPNRLSLTPVSGKEGLFIGTKSNGETYSVRKDRHAYFYPVTWNRFVATLKPQQEVLFDTLIQTGARIDEALNIRPKDYKWDRNTLELHVTKVKATKGQTKVMGGQSRSFQVGSKYCKKMRKYINDNNIGSEDKIFKMTKQGAWQLLRRKLKKIGVVDYWQYSLHNIRKTHGMWLKTLQHRGTDLDVSEICMRLGHDMNTFLKHYGSPSIFGDADRDRMIDILGDIYGLK